MTNLLKDKSNSFFTGLVILGEALIIILSFLFLLGDSISFSVYISTYGSLIYLLGIYFWAVYRARQKDSFSLGIFRGLKIIVLFWFMFLFIFLISFLVGFKFF